MKIEILNPIECRVGAALAAIIRPCLSYTAVTYIQGPYRKIRKEYQKSTMTKDDSGNFYFYTGCLRRVRDFCREKNVPVEVIGEEEKPKAGKFSLRTLTLRDEQVRLVEAALEAGRGVVKAPTGCIAEGMLVSVHRQGKGFKTPIEHMYKAFNNIPFPIVNGKRKTAKYDMKFPTKVRSFKHDLNKIELHEIEEVVYSGKKECLTLTTESRSITATPDHLILTKKGWKHLNEITKRDEIMCDNDKPFKKEKKKRPFEEHNWCNLWYHPYGIIIPEKTKKGFTKRVEKSRIACEAKINNISIDDLIRTLRYDEEKSKTFTFINPSTHHVHHKDHKHTNNDFDNLELMTIHEHFKYHSQKSRHNFHQGEPHFERVLSITNAGEKDTYDIICKDPYRNFVANGIVVHNSGKTAMGLAIISAYKDAKVLWLCHTKDLMYQAGGVCEKELGVKVGYLGDGNNELFHRVTMATRQSFIKVAEDYGHVYDVVILDECFHENTLVNTVSGMKKIKDIKINDQVYSEKGINKVTRLFKNKVPLERVIKITLSNGKIIFSTKEHLFKVNSDWKQADALLGNFLIDIYSNSSYMMSNIILTKMEETTNETTAKSDKNLSCLPDKIQYYRDIGSTFLFKKMCLRRSDEKRNEFSDHEQNKHSSERHNLNKDEEKQPLSYERSSRKTIGNPPNKWYNRFQKAWREWKGTNNLRTSFVDCLRQFMGIQFAYCNIPQSAQGTTETRRLPYMLQSRYREQMPETCGRGGRQNTSNEISTGTRPEERTTSERTRVDSIKIYKRGSNDQSFSSIIGDKERNQGFVEFHDLEVENDHSYYVEGVLVHNCHHLSSMTGQYADILTNILAPIRIGLTATLPTEQEALLAIESFIGPLIDEVTVAEGQELGIMADIKIKFLKVPLSHKVKDLRKYQDVYEWGVVKREDQHKLIAETVLKEVTTGNSVLVIVNRIDHGNNLLEAISRLDIPCMFAQGATDSDLRKEIKEALNNKDIHCVIATTIFREGIDIPELNVIINAAGGKSEISTLQAIGRGLRLTKTKRQLTLYDIFDPSNRFLVEHFGERICLFSNMNWI